MSNRKDFSFLEIVGLIATPILGLLILAWLKDIIVLAFAFTLWIGSIFATCVLIEDCVKTKKLSDIWVAPVPSFFGGLFLWYCLVEIFGINYFELFKTAITNVIMTCLIALIYAKWKI